MEKNIKIFLDDVRPTPEGFVRTYTVWETIELLKRENGNIDTVSLDNDLGLPHQEGRFVARFIEEGAALGHIKPIPNLIVHSANPVAELDMKAAFKNAQKFWYETSI